MYQFGEKIRFDLFGKSHADCVGGILEGLPAGVRIDETEIAEAVALRKPVAKIGTPRAEDDKVEIVQGLTDGKTDGNPLLIIIRNKNTDGSKYLKFSTTPRPGHADLPALVKFPEHDIRGGGQFSGRLTVAIVATGNICEQFNRSFGIETAAYTSSIGNIEDKDDRSFEEARGSRVYPTRSCTEDLDKKMYGDIVAAGNDGDSVGGTVTCITEGLPIGFGGIWFDALDALIAKAMFGIPACKGIEFGKGFGLGRMRGSQSNDPYYYDNGVRTRTNNMGGIVGGMSDGAPMVFRTVFKPTPSIAKEQDTVDLDRNCNDKVAVTGRHDPCIVPRAVIVVECMTALVIADQIMKEKVME
jgi:chorismate synthase